MGIITTFVSILFYPPLLVLRFFSFLALLPARIFLLPLRIFYNTFSTIYSAAWEFFKTFFPHSLAAPGFGAIIGYIVHRIIRFLSPLIQIDAEPSPPPIYERRAPKHLNLQPPSIKTTWTTPLLTPPESVFDVPVSPSPLNALLPPDSPLLSRNQHQYSPTDPMLQRPQQNRNVSYKSTMRQLMAERQEQLIALHEEEKKRRAALQLSPLPDSPAPAGTKGWKDVQSSPMQPPGYNSSSSPLMSSPFLRERKKAPRPTSWPPLAVVPSVPGAGNRAVTNPQARARPASGSYASGYDRGARERNQYQENNDQSINTLRRGLGLESLLPDVPRTILEEDTESDESDDDF